MTRDFENRHWTRILGDHMVFFTERLAPFEKAHIETAKGLRDDSYTFYKSVGKDPNIESKILPLVYEIREFKLTILSEKLQGKVNISLSPTFINHMVNELDEYLRFLSPDDPILPPSKIAPEHELARHELWLPDAAGHLDAIITNLDVVESDLRKRCKKLKIKFRMLWEKTVEFIGYTRTGLDAFPPLDRLYQEAHVTVLLFIGLLDQISEQQNEDKIVSILTPLMLDHMLREEAYYLGKLNPTDYLQQKRVQEIIGSI